ncbi:hypothetical protein HMPREF3155_02815 [Corynebacterium sp. HMSC06D04]|uniref:hypothetical protein n=1 Tax=Corynebacterium TaxID=1716 RepID=UPI0008A65D9C|nr:MULTISPECIES: hypothetical protein [Corynebacterium]MDK7137984.1 hypothetical protein [Corynebacterium simulans]OFQ46785.1 hypothetical protein HMPREF2935_04160 [Corynebacterium sp. HMSC076D02]OFR40556.1 hypothetical protein HMPREF2888_06330 [Corynebacterium sp. HMSC077D03]OFT32065.1 hypothetical protein HMPREF3169_11995 [Corynebacterium sp. HMSC08C04]OFT52548.1 hypothetical protein HMPREF3155_02815 [Corynebacterium sp. HMSC06D04]
MGRLILLVLVVLAAVLVWKAFGPSSWKKPQTTQQRPAIKGPDDDEEFLWNLEKERFKERRAREMQAEREAEERRRQQRRESHRDEPSRDETDEK